MLSILSLLFVLILSILVTRIATVALTYTGLSRQSAKFQARSAFTGVGFTTSESEKAVNHPIRRKILLLLMLLGNAGVITAISSLIISFVSAEQSSTLVLQVIFLVAGVSLIWALASSKWLDRQLSNLIARMLERYTRFNIQDYANLLHLKGDYQIVELHVSPGDWVTGHALAELKLRQEGLVVLGLTREGGEYLGIPDGETEIRPGDTLIIYGRVTGVRELDQRQKGKVGNKQHHQEVRIQQRISQEQKHRDEEE